MRIISRSTLNRFAEALKGSQVQIAVRKALNLWMQEVEAAEWTSGADVKEKYRNASIINSERVVFNIKGNDYRLVVAIDYRRQVVFIKWIGTHREYDRIDAAKVEYDHQANTNQ